jgi:multiple sugar transport system ATP-binding protein
MTAGELRIGDRVINDVPPKERDVAMVFQNYALYPHMAVAEDMSLALKLKAARKQSSLQGRRRAAEILGIAWASLKGLSAADRKSCILL